MYQFVKTLNVRQALLQKNGEHFVASFAEVPFSGTEVLVFPADENGEVTDWLEVDGGSHYASLNQFLNENLSR